MANTPHGTYSATVRICLHVGGKMLNVAQVGPASLILREKFESPPADARLEIIVDGRRQEYRIYLHEGISNQREEVAFL
jgi:hypothetical protein